MKKCKRLSRETDCDIFDVFVKLTAGDLAEFLMNQDPKALVYARVGERIITFDHVQILKDRESSSICLYGRAI